MMNQNRAGFPNAFCTDAPNASSANALERPRMERARVILGQIGDLSGNDGFNPDYLRLTQQLYLI